MYGVRVRACTRGRDWPLRQITKIYARAVATVHARIAYAAGRTARGATISGYQILYGSSVAGT